MNLKIRGEYYLCIRGYEAISRILRRRKSRNYHVTERESRNASAVACGCFPHAIGMSHRYGSMQKGRLKHKLERSKYRIKLKD